MGNFILMNTNQGTQYFRYVNLRVYLRHSCLFLNLSIHESLEIAFATVLEDSIPGIIFLKVIIAFNDIGMIQRSN